MTTADPDRPTPLAGAPPRWARAALFAAWLAVALYLQMHHAPWRDEVRAYTLATDPPTLAAMLRAIHGEGHPALWYLLLRAVHAVVGGPIALPVAGLAVGTAAAALLAFRAPLAWWTIALALFGAWTLFDFTVIARNYGLSLLLLLAFADRYAHHRDRGIVLGVILFLLCSANAPSVLLAGGLLLFWAVDLLVAEGWRWTPAKRVFAINAAIAAAGALDCVATIYPPANDAVDFVSAGGVESGWRADLTASFDTLAFGLRGATIGWLAFAAMVVGAPIGLARRPAALAAGIAGFVALGGFFAFVFPGFYRHQALYLAYLLALYWLVAAGPARRASPGAAVLARWGGGAFALLLALQAAMGVLRTVGVAQGGVLSRSRDLAALLERPALRRAVVIGEPDIMLEPLPWYVGNPLYLVRERRFGRVVAFTKAARRTVTLAELLASARALRATTHRPVAIVLAAPLDPGKPVTVDRGYLGAFATRPADVRAFLAATRRLARFGPAETDESYDVYVLNEPVTAS